MALHSNKVIRKTFRKQRLHPRLAPCAVVRSRFHHTPSITMFRCHQGIWPESKSFNDDGYGPIPKRWKGVCQSGEDFNSSHCNRKLIGARFYDAGIPPEYVAVDYVSPRGTIDHGTHVASIAVGSYVENANYSGLGTGLARGGAPRARLAMYKVAWGNETLVTGTTASLLKAVDDAIHDNVDVLCLSLVVEKESFGTLHAIKKGITVRFSR